MPHGISVRTLHFIGAVLDSAPEITASDYKAYLDAHFTALLDCFADTAYHSKVESAMLIAGQGFAADLQQDTAVFNIRHGKFTPSSFPYRVLF